MHVQLFIPCFVDQLFPDTAFNMIKVLKKLGCTVSYNPSQTCCGQPAFNAGYVNESREVCSKFIRDFAGPDYIVAPSGSCTGFVRNYYQKMFNKDADKVSIELPGKRMYEFTEFIVDVLKVTDLGAAINGVATYHDACGALRECHIKNAPRQLLSHVTGLELREMEDCEVCCGFGGTFAVKFESISIAMCEQKIIHAVSTGADFIISTDLSCLMHLDGYIKKHDNPIKIMHIADVLASGW